MGGDGVMGGKGGRLQVTTTQHIAIRNRGSSITSQKFKIVIQFMNG